MDTVKFTTAKDYKQLFTAAALGYAPHLGLFVYQHGAQAILPHVALVSGMALMLGLPYAREIPFFVVRFLVMPFVARKQTEPSPQLKAIFNEVAIKAGMPKLELYQYEKGPVSSALAIGNGVYLGKELIDRLDEQEIKGVIAHEISHHKTNDFIPGYVLLVPYWNSILTGIGQAVALATAFLHGGNFKMAALSAAGAYGYYKYQAAVHAFGSRVMEYRADRNAVALTNDPDAMIRALVKITYPDERVIIGDNIFIPDRPTDENRTELQEVEIDASEESRWNNLFLSHPTLIDRWAAISRQGDAMEAAAASSPKPPSGP